MHKRTVGIGNKKRDLKFVSGPGNVLTHLRAGAFSRSVCVNKLFSFFLSLRVANPALDSNLVLKLGQFKNSSVKIVV